MKEIYLDENNGLIDENKWKNLIGSIKTNFDNLETNKERAKRVLKDKIMDAVKKRTENLDNFGILFSGGVDSSLIALICKQLGLNFTCYSVGLENSQDIEAAKKVAESYNLNLKYKILSLEEFEGTIKNVVKILDSAEIVWVSVGSVVYAAGKLAVEDNNHILFGGLGSEELFAGYQRHEEALKQNDFESLHNECWNGLKNMWQRDLLRDSLIAKNMNLELRTPYLDSELIKYAMQIHPMYKLDKNNKKIILREVAKELGLKHEFAFRPKKAAQYGSNFVKGIDKLAKKNNFSSKKNYLQSLI
jgi:asparagine synthase (glutamine-hydrolysing)